MIRRVLVALVLCVGWACSASAQIAAVDRLRATTGSVDVTDPTGSITGPTSNSTYDAGTNASIALAGSCADASGVTLAEYSYDGGVWTVLSGTTSWSGTVAIAVGTANVQVRCTDGAGRVAVVDTLAVTRSASSGSTNCNGACLAEVYFSAAQGWSADKMQTGPGSGATPLTCTNAGGVSSIGAIHTGAGTVNWYSTGYATENAKQEGDSNGCSRIVAAADLSGDDRAYRHPRGDGVNIQGGGISVGTWASNLTNISVAWLMRDTAGMGWATSAAGGGSAGTPHYRKDWYFLGSQIIVLGHQGGKWGVHVGCGSVNYAANQGTGVDTYAGLMGGNVSDGLAHEFAVYIDIPTTTIRMWVDDTKVLERTDVNFSCMSAIPSTTMHTDNQSCPDNDNDGVCSGDYLDADDGYTDFDAIIVDTNVSNNGKLEAR